MIKSLILIFAIFSLIIGCQNEDNYPLLTITSPAFGNLETISVRHSCEGEGLSPALFIQGVPENAAQLAVLVEDLNGEDSNGEVGLFTHWIIWGIPAASAYLGEGIPLGLNPMNNIFQGRSDSGDLGYYPPCPSKNEKHIYYFKVFALDFVPNLHPASSRSEFLHAIDGHIMGFGELVGLYKI